MEVSDPQSQIAVSTEIGVAAVDVIRAALQGKFINHLITDQLTGEKLLID